MSANLPHSGPACGVGIRDGRLGLPGALGGPGLFAALPMLRLLLGLRVVGGGALAAAEELADLKSLQNTLLCFAMAFLG